MTVKQAAAMLGVSVPTMNRRIKDLEIPTKTNELDRRQRLIPREVVERLKAENAPSR